MTGPNQAPEFADSKARSDIESRLDETLFVEAGAGTGKTSALVRRVVALIDSGRAELRDIAAITFTQAAAAELASRIHDAFAARASNKEGSDVAARAISQLDEAAFTTIHGFAMRILADHPLQARLPLRFRVLDEIESTLRFERDCAAFLDEFFDDRTARVLVAACVTIGITPAHLRALLLAFDDSDTGRAGLSAEVPSEALLAEELPRLVHDGVRLLSERLQAVVEYGNSCVDPDDQLYRRTLEVNEALFQLGRANDWLDELSWLVALREQRVGRAGRAPNWKGSPIAEVRSAFADGNDVRAELLSRVHDLVLRVLTSHLREVSEAWSGRRRIEGELTFADLLVLTRDVLRDDEQVRRSVRTRYRRILVDEFQDTDPLQLEILLLLARDDEGAIEPGRLFFVGDPRQSIYRFRGAQPELYDRAARQQYGATTVELSTNFRSVPGVLEFVNGLFFRLAQGDGDDPPSPTLQELFGTQPLQAARGAHVDGLPVFVIGGALDDSSAQQRRAVEAGEIADAIRSLVDEAVPVLDGEEARPARFADVAVLVPRRTSLYELEAAFDRSDVPYRLESAALIYESSEARDLLASLRALASPSDERALIAALRTPLFACGDDDLLTYRRAGGQWRIDAEVPAGLVEHCVPSALSYLRSLWSRRNALGLYETVLTLVQERHVTGLAVARRHPREAMRRIEFLLDQLRGFVEAGGVSLAEFVSYADLQREARARHVEVTGQDDDDAVHILTIHGAKGLEFPIVIVGDLGGASRGSPQLAQVHRDDESGHEVRVGAGIATLGFSDLHERATRADEEERLRLCYVATTRARDYLVLSLTHRPARAAASRSLAERLSAGTVDRASTWRRIESARTGRRAGVLPTAPVGDGEESAAPSLSEAYALAQLEEQTVRERSSRPMHIAASALSVDSNDNAPHGRRRSANPWEDGPSDELAFLVRRQAASALGRAVHAVLQAVGLSNGADLDRTVEEMCAGEGIPERKATVRTLVESALSSPSVATGAASSTSWRELPVTAVIDGRVLEAVLDLAYERDGEIVVVDYKTDALDDPAEAQLIASRYRLQAGAYALALGATLGRSVTRVVLVFLALPSGAVEVEVPDLDGAMSEARAVLVTAVDPLEHSRMSVS